MTVQHETDCLITKLSARGQSPQKQPRDSLRHSGLPIIQKEQDQEDEFLATLKLESPSKQASKPYPDLSTAWVTDRPLPKLPTQSGSEHCARATDRAFSLVDKNSDNRISRGEFKDVFGESRAGEEFDRVDANHDGVISRDEYAAAYGHADVGQQAGPNKDDVKSTEQGGHSTDASAEDLMTTAHRMLDLADTLREPGNTCEIEEVEKLAVRLEDAAKRRFDSSSTSSPERGSGAQLDRTALLLAEYEKSKQECEGRREVSTSQEVSHSPSFSCPSSSASPPSTAVVCQVTAVSRLMLMCCGVGGVASKSARITDAIWQG